MATRLQTLLRSAKKASGVGQFADDAEDTLQAFEWALRSKDPQHAINVLLKMACQHAQQLRDLASSEWLSAVLPTKATVVVKGRAAGKHYSEAAQIAELRFVGAHHICTSREPRSSLWRGRARFGHRRQRSRTSCPSSTSSSS
ncbi:unnamed protein product [Prorocentrum cordatum]|uniref:Uncharacterized protein n=1 Tax=Prorocentrum cordatum TaxID=2364126 RepID=A0ABN9SEW0_9DINO|nr:unnamed protein product [Polarella glacialis]